MRQDRDGLCRPRAGKDRDLMRLRIVPHLIVLSLLAGCGADVDQPNAEEFAPRWNILFIFADDWGRFAGHYADIDRRPSPNEILDTPHMDRVAAEGVVFRNAFVNSPSCTPSRSALFSGRHFFNTGRGAILRPAFWDDTIPAYPQRLVDAGYHIGKSLKAWSPGSPVDAPIGGSRFAYEAAGKDANKFSTVVTDLVASGVSIDDAKSRLLEEVRSNFRAFLDAKASGKPWHYFFGPINTHRPWIRGSGEALWGIDPGRLEGHLPAYLPDVSTVREDVADYLGEIQALDAYIGVLLAELEWRGELDSTLIIMSGDHGMPGIPSGKATLYDGGTLVALTARVPGAKPGRVIDDVVSLADLAPTFVAIAGGEPLPGIYGRSLLPQLRSDPGGQIDARRDHVIIGRERHVDFARDGFLPYPQRALRTDRYLYIRNFAPERWPMGLPPGSPGIPAFADMDGGPTKAWLLANRDEAPGVYERAFARRPLEELYDVRADPDQLENLANDPEFAVIRGSLASQLLSELEAAGDPRVTGDGGTYDRSPFTDVSDGNNRYFDMETEPVAGEG